MENRPISRVCCGSATGFFYQHFARGSRRAVFDGLEPAFRLSESIQFEFFEYVYHQILRQDDEWAALRNGCERDIRAQEPAPVTLHRCYDQRAIGCLCLYTTPEVMLEDLMARPISTSGLA